MNLVNNHLNHHQALHMTKVDAIGTIFGGIAGIIKGLISGKIALLGMFAIVTWTQIFDTLLIGGVGALGGLIATMMGTWMWGLIKKWVLGLFKKKLPRRKRI